MTRNLRRTRIAVFALIATGIVLLTLFAFGASLWRSRDHYVIDFVGTVYGLERGGDVYCEGIRIGNVSSLKIDHDRLGIVHVGILVDRDTPIRTDTKAFLLFAGVTGVKEIDLRGGTNDGVPLPPGSTIAVGESELDMLQHKGAEVATRALHLLDRADRVATNLADLTDRSQLGDLVDQTRLAAKDITATSHALRTTLAASQTELKGAIASIGHAAEDASTLFTGFAGPASSIAARTDDLIARLDEVVRTNAGQLRSTISELNRASRSFSELARDLRESPSQLLFSKPPPARRP